MSKKKIISSLTLLFLFTFSVIAQQKTGTIKGRVTDAETNEVLIGANIILLSTQIGAATDIDGNYIIRNVPFGSYKLAISFVGYETKTLGPFEIKSDNSLNVNVDLKSDTDLNVNVSLETSWGKLSAEDAWKDINNGIIQIYLCGWPLYSKEHADLAEKYGFNIACTGCQPLNTTRYDSVMVDYLKKRNGENWYEKFLVEWNKIKY